MRVLRGGGWGIDDGNNPRCADRDCRTPDWYWMTLGFRLAR